LHARCDREGWSPDEAFREAQATVREASGLPPVPDAPTPRSAVKLEPERYYAQRRAAVAEAAARRDAGIIDSTHPWPPADRRRTQRVEE